MRLALLALAAAGLASLTLAGSAGADSIVYVKKGNVWIAKPSGSAQHRVTSGGHWSSPSQADDGTIVALHGSRFVRMRQTGKRIGKPFDGMGSGANSGDFEGPYDPRVSPNGKKIAYWFLQRGGYNDPGCNCFKYETKSHVAVSRSNRFTDPTKAGVLDAFRAPSWIGNRRLLVSDYADVGTYVVGWNNYGYQGWYNDYENAWAIHHQELSPRGDKLAVVHGDASGAKSVLLYSASGSPFAGPPPYDDYQDGAPHPNPPSGRCQMTGDGTVGGPSWSPDNHRLAISDTRHGIYVADFPNLANCAQGKTRLVIKGGKDPDWGPANVRRR